MIDKCKKFVVEFGKKSKVGFGLKTNDWGLLWTTGSQQYL